MKEEKKKKKKERRGKERSWFLVRISLDSCTQGRDFWDELIAAMGFLDLLRSGLSRRNCPDNFSSIFRFSLAQDGGVNPPGGLFSIVSSRDFLIINGGIIINACKYRRLMKS